MLRTLLLTLLIGGSAFAQTLTKPPTVLKHVEPLAPQGDGGPGPTGTVVMEVDIGPDGKVMEARVTQTAGAALDQAALAAIKQFEFTPAEIDNAPAAVRIQYSMEFAPAAPPEEPDAGLPDAGHAPVVNLAGTLRVASTREPLAAALITVGELTATSDEQGHFELADVPLGSVEVAVSAAGFEAYKSTEVLKPGERTEVLYYLTRDRNTRETVVRGTRDRREVTQVKLKSEEFRTVAGTQGDAFKVIQSLPGVARSPFGNALIVRGSKAWDSRVYVDEIQIPQLFHFAGLTATFNSSVVDSIAFQPGNFGAEFGRSIGGLVQAEVRTPSKKGIHGYVDLSTFDVSAMIEAPLSDKWSVSASARRGLSDFTLPWAIKTFANGVVGFSLAPTYWDYQARAEYRGEGPNRFFVQAYGSSDRYSFVQPNPFLDTDTEGNQGSAGNAVLYNRLVVGIDRKLSERVMFISRNSVGFDQTEQLGGATDLFYRSTEVPIQARERLRIEVPEANLTLSTGVDLLVIPALLNAQVPPPFKANEIPDPYVNRRLLVVDSTTVNAEPGVFVEGKWRPLETITVVAGVRADYQSVMKKAWADPRLTLLYQPLEWLTLKAGAGLYHQPPNYQAGQLSPQFGNPNLLPEGAVHIVAGGEVKFSDYFSADVQGYYKDLFDQTRQVLVSQLGSDINIPGAATRYSSSGYGRAYGVDVLLRGKYKGFTGWIAYSRSKFERDAYVSDCGHAHCYAPGALDQPNNLIVVAGYTFPLGFSAGARFRWTSGPLYTPVVASMYDVNGNYYYPLPGLPWSKQLPDFFQLDARVDKRFTFKEWALTVYADVQNVTNQKNPEGLFYNFNYTQRAYVYGLPIIPTVGLRGEW